MSRAVIASPQGIEGLDNYPPVMWLFPIVQVRLWTGWSTNLKPSSQLPLSQGNG